MLICATSIPHQPKRPSSSFTHKRRTLEKARIQKLKLWHEDVKKIARSEIDFIASIFKDDKNAENRDWVRDFEEDESDDEERDGFMVEKKP